MVSMAPIVSSDESPEVKLGLAVIVIGVLDARGSDAGRRAEARSWLTSPSFRWWGEMLDLPETVIERVSAVAEELEPGPVQPLLFEMA